jgi:Tfp pilus assembly protein PilN
MQSINLLPPGYAQKQRSKRRLMIGAGVMVAALLATFGLSRLMDKMVRKKEAEVRVLAEEAADLGATRSKLASCNLRLSQLSGQLAVVYTLDRNRRWASCLAEIAESTQDSIFLTRVHVDPARGQKNEPDDDDPVSRTPVRSGRAEEAGREPAGPQQLVMRIQGYAISNTDVTRFISALSKTGLFEKVSFLGSEMALMKTRHLSKFELACPIRFVPRARPPASTVPANGSVASAERAAARVARISDEEVRR